MNPFSALVLKDLKLFFRDRRAVILTFAVPIVIGSFLGYVTGGQSGRPQTSGVGIHVVDLDQSPVSREIVGNLQKDPALKMVLDIDATLIAASPEAAKYVPQQLSDVQRQYAALKVSFDKQDYAGVMGSGPRVLAAAQTLATAAAAKKDEVLKVQNDDWTGLAAVVPDEATAIQSRIDQLSMKANKKARAGLDLDADKAALSDALSLWSKATAAFAAGNLDEAVMLSRMAIQG